LSSQQPDRWLYIDPYVHLNVKGTSALLYNPLNGDVLEYVDAAEIAALVARLQLAENLRVVPLSANELRGASPIAAFVADLKEAFMGGVVDGAFSDARPVQLAPQTTVQSSPGQRSDAPIRPMGESVLAHLRELYLYLNEDCQRSCTFCPSAWRQFPCCSKGSASGRELELSAIATLFKQAQNSDLVAVNLLGGDVFAYGALPALVELIEQQGLGGVIHAHYLQIPSSDEVLSRLDRQRWTLSLMVPAAKVEHQQLAEVLARLAEMGFSYEATFVVESEEELSQAQALAESMSIGQATFRPHYNGNNLSLFEATLFFTRESIVAQNPSIRELHANTVANKWSMGKLSVSANGDVYANLACAPLGRCGRDSLHDMLSQELGSESSWRRVRMIVEPCKDCLYQVLCPPLSNYSFAIGRNDLCHLRSESQEVASTSK
jgi:pseudo-rSAM protein